MKLKKGLFSVVFLLAISSVMAAMSFSSASVTSDMSVTLTDTSKSLLALEESTTHNASYYTRVNAGKPMQLGIDLDKGNGNVDFGVQANSVYKWNELFKVTNNSEHAVDVKISTTGGTTPNALPHFASIGNGEWKNLATTSGGLTFSLAAGESTWINVMTDTMNGDYIAAGERTMDLVVEAVKK